MPRWYGETIGFWDGATLITWTSDIQGWATQAAFEHSNRMPTIRNISVVTTAMAETISARLAQS